MSMHINQPHTKRVSFEQTQPTPKESKISSEPDFSYVEKVTVFGGVLKNTISWVPGLLVAPFATLIGDTTHWSPSKVAKVVFLSPLAALASIAIAGNLLAIGPIIGATALINAGIAARTGEDIAGREVLLSEHKGELKIDISSKYAPRLNLDQKKYDEMGNVVTSESVKYKDILNKNKNQK